MMNTQRYSSYKRIYRPYLAVKRLRDFTDLVLL